MVTQLQVCKARMHSYTAKGMPYGIRCIGKHASLAINQWLGIVNA
jgi:hypothetical protein